MTKMLQATIPCIQCRQPFRVNFQNVVDAKQDPQAKMRLLTGQFNLAQCPNCGAPNTMLTPLVYHDPAKELLITYVPMELNLAKEAQEKAIGDMVKEVTSELPQGAFKAYLLQPRQALTLQGLIDQVLQADGVTPEMMEEQRSRVRLIESMLEAADDELETIVRENDAQIDSQFMQTMSLLAQRMLQEGRQALAERLVMVQNHIVELSSFGQQLVERARVQEEVIQQVADEVNALGEDADRPDFLNLAIRYGDDEARLQALVGLVRPVFDYQFFQDMQVHIGQAAAAERPQLETLREKLLELTALADQQTRAALQDAATLLQAVINSPNPQEVIEANLPMIDVTFMQVLSANIQEAERRGDSRTGDRLKTIYNQIVAMLQASMPPELQFINDVLSAQSPEEAKALIAERVRDFDGNLLDAIDAIEGQIAEQNDPALSERLNLLREQATQALG